MIKNITLTMRILWKIITFCFLTYAVVFSVAGTIAIVYGYMTLTKPLRDVQFLIDHNPKETAYMTIYRGELRAKGKPDTLTIRFVPLDSIAKNLQNAVVASEDDGFYTHPGIDIEAILKAAEYNREKNKMARGASTITQQLAKNLFLDGDKNFLRKAKEFGYTLLLEKYLTKKRILELYLNYAQWGETVFGCEAASRMYYKKPCSHLSIQEASRMAATLAMPSRVTPLNTASVFIQKRVEVIANNLYRRHMIDDSGYTVVSGLAAPKDSSDDSMSGDGN